MPLDSREGSGAVGPRFAFWFAPARPEGSSEVLGEKGPRRRRA